MSQEHHFHHDYVLQRDQPQPSKKTLKYRFAPDFRLPPGVKGSRVAVPLLLALGISAIPIWGLPYLTGSNADPKSKEEQEAKELIFMYAKKKNREKRMAWIHSDEMPYK